MKFYKKIVHEEAWTQPILGSNGTVGGNAFACYATRQCSGYEAWRALDGVRTAGNGNSSWGTGETCIPCDFVFYYPKPLKVTNLQIWNRTYGNNCGITAGCVYGSNDNIIYTPIKSFTNGITGHNQAWNIDLSNNKYGYKYYAIQITGCTAYYGNYKPSMGELVITGTIYEVDWQECTLAEYMNLAEDERRMICNVPKIFSSKKYYKKGTVEKEYEQPTANYGLSGKLAISGGTISNQYGNVLQNNPINQSSTHNAFNGGSSTLAQYTGGQNPMFQWVCAVGENVLPILSHITFTTDFSGYVMGSNDRANWVTIPNSNFGSGYHDIALNTQYKYYCIQATTANGGYATDYGYYYTATLTNVRLYGTVTKQAWVNCTQAEYHQLPGEQRNNINNKYCIKRNNRAYLAGGVDNNGTIKRIIIEETLVPALPSNTSIYGTCSFGGNYYSGNYPEGQPYEFTSRRTRGGQGASAWYWDFTPTQILKAGFYGKFQISTGGDSSDTFYGCLGATVYYIYADGSSIVAGTVSAPATPIQIVQGTTIVATKPVKTIRVHPTGAGGNSYKVAGIFRMTIYRELIV